MEPHPDLPGDTLLEPIGSADLSTRDNGMPIGQMRVLALTGRSPQNAIVDGPAAEPELTERLSRALLAFEPLQATGAPRVGDTLRITGYTPPTAETWSSIRAILDERQGASAPP